MEENRINMADEVEMIKLRNALFNLTKPQDYEDVFIKHSKSKVIDKILFQQLIKISQNSEYIAPNVGSKLSLNIMNDNKFSYSIFLVPTGDNEQKTVVWKGDSQILAVKGTGSVKVKVLQIPNEININDFEPGCHLTQVDERILKDGDVIANWDVHKIVEVVEAYSPVVIESLEIKDPTVEYYWAFDANMCSVGLIPAKLFLARLKLIIDLGIEIDETLPQIYYDTIMTVGDAQTKFRAIEAMLLEGHPDAESHFQIALESSDPILAGLAQDLYNKIIAHQ